jgi:hypothetical protein
MSRFTGMRKSYASASKLINPKAWLGFGLTITLQCEGFQAKYCSEVQQMTSL